MMNNDVGNMFPKRNWYLFWIIAFLGFPVGGAAAVLVIGRLDTALEGVIGGAVAGLFLGLFQYAALRQYTNVKAGWIVATTIGLAIGVGLSTLLYGADTTLQAILTRAPLTGSALAIAQWIVLRYHTRMAYVWIITLPVIYTIAWYVTVLVIGASVDQRFVIFGASGAIVFQLLTGLVLYLLNSTGK